MRGYERRRARSVDKRLLYRPIAYLAMKEIRKKI
jgi:hypothetical protein